MTKFRSGYGLNYCLKSIGLNKQTYFNHKTRHPCSLKTKYREIEKAIRKILIKNPGYGYRRLLIALEKDSHHINHKTLRKLLKETKLGFLQRKNRIRRKSGIEKILDELGAKVNLIKKLEGIKLFQVLYTDFTELVYAHGSKKTNLIVYLEAISKRILGYHIGPGNTVSALTAYRKAKNYLKKQGIKLNKVMIHQDQGSPFKSYDYVRMLLQDNINLSYSRKGHFEDNPEMESFFGRLKDEWRDEIFEIETVFELNKFVKRILMYYNKNRIHSCLGKYSPDEFIKIHHQNKKTKTFLKKG